MDCRPCGLHCRCRICIRSIIDGIQSHKGRGCGISKEKHSPTPWKIAENCLDWRSYIEDAGGREVVACWGGNAMEDCKEQAEADAAFIVNAVNLYALLDAARTDGEGYKHILTVKGEDGKPTCIITPPVSETELVRMYKTESHNLFKDRIMLERQVNELWHERNRLRNLVRDLADALDEAWGHRPPTTDAALLMQARKAIREGAE